ncbi:MAG: hypothetical protein ACI8S6_004829 [Myxococcota bacterium]|jgi:hypothetical protein
MMMSSLSLLLAALLPAAQAAPDKLAATFAVGTSVTDLRADDSDWLSGIVDGEVWLLSARTWASQTIASACSGGSAAATAFYDDGSDLVVYVGCDDGTVDVVRYATSSGDWSLDSTGTAADTDTGDTSDDTAVSYDFGAPVLDLQVYADTIYALVENKNSGGSPVVRSLLPGAVSVDSETTWSVTTTNGAFVDGALNDSTGVYYVMHSSDNVSVVTLGSGAITSDFTSTGGSGRDIAVFDSYVLMAGGNRGILTYTSGNLIQVALLDADNMDDVTAVGSYGQRDGVIAADVTSSSFLLYSMSTATLSVSAKLVDAISYDSEGEPVELVELDRGYTLAATDAGEVFVLTENPWVELVTSDGLYDSIATGSDISLSFTSDEGGDWVLRIGEDGDIVDSGEIEAGASGSAGFTVSDGQLSEGLNELWLVVTDSLGNDGHDSYEVVVDQPPDQVTLTADGVGFGNGSIIVSFDGVDDEDLERYDIYVSLQSFAAADYSATGTGGPAFCTASASTDTADTEVTDCDVVAAVSVPVEVSAGGGESVYVEIEDVDNGYTYYVAARAVDAGGLEGPMSTVRSVVPQEAYSAAQLAGEDGGFCGSPLPASLALAGLGGLMALIRRRRSATLLAMVATVGLSSGAAHAEDMAGAKARPSPWTKGSAFQLGSVAFDGTELTSIYGSSGNIAILASQSFSLRHILELDAAVGYTRGRGSLVSSSGTASSDDVRLSMLPLSLSGTLRLDFFENQPIVPYASFGADYWLWRENWDNELRLVTADAIGGGKLGYHWAVGGQLLLDIFEPDQASALAARTGIQDSYLTFEMRNNNFSDLNDEGLTFDGTQISAGLRFDY